MSRKKVVGTCHICGTYGPLSYEHVPPEAAFNDRPVMAYAGAEMLKHGLDLGAARGTILQRGFGAYTLCGRCNSITGHRYAPYFIDWAYQGMLILMRSGGKPTLIYMNYLRPLPILKQIATMFFSVNTAEFRLAHPYLVEFVLNRDRKYLPPDLRFYAYYVTTRSMRLSGVSGSVDVNTGQIIVMSEIAFLPFGFVLTFDSAPPDPRLVDITHFARYDYYDVGAFDIKLPTLPTHLMVPGDYRTREDIAKDAEAGRRTRSQSGGEATL